MAAEIKSVLFDLDNTLADRTSAFQRLCEHMWGEEPAIQAAVDAMTFHSLMSEWDNDGRTFPKSKLLERAAREWNELNHAPVNFDSWYEHNYPSFFEPDPRVNTLIESLNRSGIPWGIVTNGQHYQEAVVEKIRLSSLHSGIVISAVFGASKPDPTIFHEGLRLIGHQTDPTGCLFVGDNPVADIGGARKAGLSTAWVTRGTVWPLQEFRPDFTVDHVHELSTILGL